MIFDPSDPAFVADPYPTFAALRAEALVQWHEGLGQYVALSHASADTVLRDRSLGRIWRLRWPEESLPAFTLLHVNSLLENEPPTHTRLRRLVSAAFTRGRIEGLRGRIEAIAAGLVGDLREAGADGSTVDVLPVFAEPLPVAVICELLGVPESDRHLLRPWSNAIVKMYEPDAPEGAAHGLTPSLRRRAEEAATAYVAYVRDLLAHRRAHPGEDFLSELVQVRDADGDRLSEDELVATAVLLQMAGHEASVNVVGNGLLALLSHPEQLARVHADPGLVPAAVEELIRYDSPLQMFERTATADTEVAGVTIPQGAKIAALLGAANRDPGVFADPDRLDVGRKPNPHLGFGVGIHFCLGAPLARLELQVALGSLLRDLPGLALAGDAVRRPEFVIRGLATLPVATTA